MNILKKPYEISVWKDVIVYVSDFYSININETQFNLNKTNYYTKSGNQYVQCTDESQYNSNIIYYTILESSNLDDFTTLSKLVAYLYYTELRLAVIGSSTMTSPARTTNNIFKKNINGIINLTFDMYYLYEDEGLIIHNSLIDFVVDERKIKLYYEDKWYDFIVKKDDEKGREYKYSYTCTGLAANELGKTGFRVELDTELENNTGTVQLLGAAVLENSDWQLSAEGLQVIQLTNDEALYSAIVTSEITGARTKNNMVVSSIPVGARIYIYYTSYANLEKDYFLFIYVDGDTGTLVPRLYEDKITIYCDDETVYDLHLSNVTWVDGNPDFINPNVTVANYRGRRYVRKLLMSYDPVLELTIYKYKGVTNEEALAAGIIADKEYYGYESSEFLDATSVTNYIYNSTNFSGTSYWSSYNNTSLLARVYPDVTVLNAGLNRVSYLILKFGENGRAVNEGIVQNYSRINKFEKGEKYRFKAWVGILDGSTVTPVSIPFKCVVKHYTLIDVDSESDIKYFEFSDNAEKEFIQCKTTDTYDSNKLYYIKNNNEYVLTVNLNEETFNSNKTNYYYTDDYYTIDAECLLSATWRELNSNVGIFLYLLSSLNVGVDYYIKDIQLYRYIKSEDGHVLDIGDVPEVRIITNSHFYDPILNAGFTSAEDYIFSDTNKNYYIPLYGSGENEFEKVRSITAKESNRFNLLQELSETFECWVRFEIAHDLNGKISIENYNYYKPVIITEEEWEPDTYYIYNLIDKEYLLSTEYNENKKYFISTIRKRQSKKVIFYGEILLDNFVGFKYGINLKDNNRILDSELIVTKIIVKDNTCEQANNGFCSIARARDNPIKETFALNFDYYTSLGIIDKSALDNDLYLELNGSIGLYPRLSRYNKERNKLIEIYALEANSITRLSADYLAAQVTYNEATKLLSKLLDPASGTIFQYTGYLYEDFLNLYNRTATHLNVPAYGNEVYFIKSAINSITPSPSLYCERTQDIEPQDGKTYYTLENNYFKLYTSSKFSTVLTYYEEVDPLYTAGTYFLTTDETTSLTFTGNDSSEVYIYAAARRVVELDENDCINDNYTILKLTEVSTLTDRINTSNINMTKAKDDLDDVLADYDEIKTKLEDIAKSTEEIEKEFNTKYSRYIQEGSWTDDNYMDDDLYYLDSLDVLYLSAYPKVSYNFKVLELSQLEGYEAFKFDIASKTFVEDVEFFGYLMVDGLKTPARETVVVTEAIIDLDNPDKNDLKVLNYRSHFEDLFQRITAATLNLEYHSGEYGRAAAVITPDGTVSDGVLLKSFNTASYVILNSRDLSVTWDETGLYATNLNDPAQITRLASGGILVSADGGLTWGVAISGYGINAGYLVAGTIDTDKINIMSGSYPTFKWDSLGLRAYAFTEDNGAIRSYDPTKYVTHDRFGIYGLNGYLVPPSLNTVEDVEDTANFALTWNGLFIKSSHRDGYVRVSPTEDISLYLIINNTNVMRGKFGLLGYDNSGNEIYGISLYDTIGNSTVTTLSDGTLWLQDSIRIGDSNNQNNYPYIYIGRGEDIGQDTWKVMRVYNSTAEEDKFIVYSDGRLFASDVEVLGKVTATDGSFTGKIVATEGSIGNATITSNGLTINNGTFEIVSGGNNLAVFSVTNNSLTMRGTIYADAGTFNGTITAADGNIGGFTISEHTISSGDSLVLTSAHDGIESSIYAQNIILGTGAQIKEYLNIGNLKLLNPNNGSVLLLTDNNNLYFELTNDGYINGSNWSIGNENGQGVVARFGKLIAENGEFNGVINATDGNFSGSITSSVINATTINTANFVTSNIRAMGGAYIFRPTFEILVITDKGSNKLELAVKGDISYFNNFDSTSSEDYVVAISGIESLSLYSKTIIGKITNVDDSNEASLITILFSNDDYNILKAANALDNYRTLTLFGKSNNDMVIGINSDNTSDGNLPVRALSMETFSNVDTTNTWKVNYNLKLLLGDLSSLVGKNVSGYGLYADNVFLHGSLVTTDATNNTFAGVNTLSNVIFNYAAWGGASGLLYQNEKIIFWGGAANTSSSGIQSAPFIVTDKGNVFARSGEFKGSVISDSIITQSIIKSPTIYGTGSNGEPSLKIYNTNENKGGIGFYKLVNNIDDESNEHDDIQTLNISINGFTHYKDTSSNGIAFISFDDTSSAINFNGNSYLAGSTLLKLQELSDGNGIAKLELISTTCSKLSYNTSHGVEITDTGIKNFGGFVQNEGTFSIYTESGGSHALELNYRVLNGYYCLFVAGGV